MDQAAKDLIQVTYDCWVKAMDFCEPGRPYKVLRMQAGLGPACLLLACITLPCLGFLALWHKDIGAVIQDYVTPLGYTTVRCQPHDRRLGVAGAGWFTVTTCR